MAERRAVNKWYPPDWNPSMGSVNQYWGQHPLRERARKLKEGILIVRFEMPFNIWCGGCEKHIAMGVRFNAEKKKVGHYHSTPIWNFSMTCHMCSHRFEIQTDPKVRSGTDELTCCKKIKLLN
jgi:coiled-coil domain-containing protein 130